MLKKDKLWAVYITPIWKHIKLNMKIETKYDKIFKVKKSTDQYGKQEAEQFQGSAYVVEIRLVVLHRGQEFVEPG